MSETTLVNIAGTGTLPAARESFSPAIYDAISAMIAAQNLNNASLRTDVNQGVQYVTVALTNTQTKALNSAPTQLVAAQGAGTIIEILSIVLENKYLTGAFANGGVIQASYGAGTTIPASATVAATFLTSPAANQVIVLGGALATNLASAIVNVAVNLACATADFITGAGSVTAKVAYRVHTGL